MSETDIVETAFFFEISKATVSDADKRKWVSWLWISRCQFSFGFFVFANNLSDISSDSFAKRFERM